MIDFGGHTRKREEHTVDEAGTAANG